MLALEALSQLLEVTDRFLAKAARVDKLRAIEPAIKKLERFMSAIFSKQGKAVLAANAKYKGAYPLEESLRPEDMERIIKAIEGAEKEMAAGLVDMTGPLMEAATQALLASMPEDAAGIAFDLSNPEAVKWLDAHAAEMVTKIDETTMAQMRGLLAQSVDEGWSYNRTAKAIKEKFDGFAGKLPQAHIQSRAHLVAVTESRNAYEEANLRTGRSLQDAGLPMEKKWMDSGDSKVSAGCRNNSHAGWIPLDDSFPSGDERPPRFPGCRCDLLMQMKEEAEAPNKGEKPATSEPPETEEPQTIRGHRRIGEEDKKTRQQWAKDQHKEWAKSLDHSEKNALTKYKEGDSYKPINARLRGLKGGENIHEGFFNRWVGEMDSAIKKDGISEGVVVHRGFYSKKLGRNWDNLIGTTFKDKGYVSVSTNPEVAKMFYENFVSDKNNGVIADILLPPGTKCASLDRFSKKYGWEEELMLGRGSRFKILETSIDSDGVKHILMQLII